ncbi:MAG: RNA polymerase factor sigma-54 [Bacteroidales bacterium]|jgi:RNA polymerase sigma-54 factor|nr:RNA polymerase factor sigma-54 [Bacteroidales bacterium]
MIAQKQELQIQQRLSPRQILLMRLLQVPIVSLEQRIDQELEDNPALELAERETENTSLENNEEDEYVLDPENTSEEGDNIHEELNKEADINMDDYFAEDYGEMNYASSSHNANKDEEYPNKDEMYVSHESFQESLLAQLGMFNLSEEDVKIAEFLIGNIDDTGYLSRSMENMINDLLFNMNITTTVEHLNKLIDEVIHKFDPPGTGARDLRDCLLIQLKRLNKDKDKEQEEQEEDILLAIQIIDKYFNEFTKKHFDKIKRTLLCSDKQFHGAISILLKLNPKPGMVFSSNENNYILPDFIVSINEKTQELVLDLQNINIPELRVGKIYQGLYKELQNKKSISDEERREAMSFVKQKVNAARWFIEALSQREQTLYKTMAAIMKYQKEFFRTGDEMTLKPMVSKDIAAEIGMDISTVSRVVRLKHVLTPYGVYPLKFFFSESLTKDTGEEVSSHEIKKIITDTIHGEDSNFPYTDLMLCKVLNKKGYNIARRTIAKYREQLGIPVARLRK